MKLAALIPWRIRHRIDVLMEEKVRIKHHRLYKLLKFGRTNINTPQYWDAMWSTDMEDRNYTETFQLVLDNVPEGAKVLDVGCGGGLLLKQLKERNRADVTGLDFSSWACEQLRHQGFETIVSILPHIPFSDHTFDVVVATDVLEHLDHPEKTLEQMARVAKPGGLLMISVPVDSMHPHEELEHQQSFTQERLLALLAPLCRSVEIEGGTYPGGKDRFLLARGRV